MDDSSGNWTFDTKQSAQIQTATVQLRQQTSLHALLQGTDSGAYCSALPMGHSRNAKKYFVSGHATACGHTVTSNFSNTVISKFFSSPAAERVLTHLLLLFQAKNCGGNAFSQKTQQRIRFLLLGELCNIGSVFSLQMQKWSGPWTSRDEEGSGA